MSSLSFKHLRERSAANMHILCIHSDDTSIWAAGKPVNRKWDGSWNGNGTILISGLFTVKPRGLEALVEAYLMCM